jgi:hypothetical protein
MRIWIFEPQRHQGTKDHKVNDCSLLYFVWLCALVILWFEKNINLHTVQKQNVGWFLSSRGDATPRIRIRTPTPTFGAGYPKKACAIYLISLILKCCIFWMGIEQIRLPLNNSQLTYYDEFKHINTDYIKDATSASRFHGKNTAKKCFFLEAVERLWRKEHKEY